MGLGGAIKLTGESEYIRALKQIKLELNEVSSAQKMVASAYDKSDNSIGAIKARIGALNDVLTVQRNKLETLRAEYNALLPQFREQTANHMELLEVYEAEKKRLEEIGRELGETSDDYRNQAVKVSELSQEVENSTKVQDANEKKMSDLRVEMNKTETAINGTTKQMKELDNANNEVTHGFTVLKATLADLSSKAIQEATKALKKLGDEIINIGRQSYNSFAQYQQLAGGVETIFKDSADIVKKNAQEAYKSAGISANQYMDQVTAFSMTLLQGLGGDTAKSAEIADMAIRDMADNANKLGTSMMSIQNAYQGIAKDNYTMLDNLRLGYGGSATEMARLINDTKVLGDSVTVTAKTVKDVPFDKIIEAIHKIQVEAGITGTTVAEANETITGSAFAMQASWQNLLTAIADPKQDVGGLIDAFVESAVTAGRNALPRIQNILLGMRDAFSHLWNEVIPDLGEKLPELAPLIEALQWIKDNGPTIISIISGITAGLIAFNVATKIAGLISAFTNLFMLLKSGISIVASFNAVFAVNPIALIVMAVTALVAGLITLWKTSEDFRNFWIEAWDSIKNGFITAWEAVSAFFTETIPEAFDSVKETLGQWFDTVINWFSELPEKVGAFVERMVTNVTTFFNELPYNIGYALGVALGKIVQWINDAGSWLAEKVPQVIEAVSQFFSELPEKVGTWLRETIERIRQWGEETIQSATETARSFIERMVEFFRQLPSAVGQWLYQTLIKVGQFMSDMFQKARDGARNIFNAIVDTLKALPSEVWNIGKNLVSGIWDGISSMGSWLWNKVTSFARGILDGFKSAFKINSPSKVMADEVGEYLAEGIGVGFSDGMADVAKDMQDSIPTSFDINPRVKGTRYDSGFDTDMVSAFKEALSQMKIELDDEVAGHFVENTVARAVYAF